MIYCPACGELEVCECPVEVVEIDDDGNLGFLPMGLDGLFFDLDYEPSFR